MDRVGFPLNFRCKHWGFNCFRRHFEISRRKLVGGFRCVSSIKSHKSLLHTYFIFYGKFLISYSSTFHRCPHSFKKFWAQIFPCIMNLPKSLNNVIFNIFYYVIFINVASAIIAKLSFQVNSICRGFLIWNRTYVKIKA